MCGIGTSGGMAGDRTTIASGAGERPRASFQTYNKHFLSSSGVSGTGRYQTPKQDPPYTEGGIRKGPTEAALILSVKYKPAYDQDAGNEDQ
jgi:hypothetical protein